MVVSLRGLELGLLLVLAWGSLVSSAKNRVRVISCSAEAGGSCHKVLCCVNTLSVWLCGVIAVTKSTGRACKDICFAIRPARLSKPTSFDTLTSTRPPTHTAHRPTWPTPIFQWQQPHHLTKSTERTTTTTPPCPCYLRNPQESTRRSLSLPSLPPTKTKKLIESRSLPPCGCMLPWPRTQVGMEASLPFRSGMVASC